MTYFYLVRNAKKRQLIGICTSLEKAMDMADIEDKERRKSIKRFFYTHCDWHGKVNGEAMGIHIKDFNYPLKDQA